MAETLRWWLVVEAAGLLALPVALVLFRGLPGRGYAFAKPLGLVLTGYCFWLALSLGLLPNRPGSVVWAAMPLALASLFLLRTRGEELRTALRDRLPLVLATEAVFALALFTAAHLRSFVPEIAGTEKPMDFMMLNAAARSAGYPPQDAWLAGEGVSYYYFGYVLQAMVGKLAGLPAAVVFNLAVASTAALAATAAFGLGYELSRLARQTTVIAGLATGAAAVVLLLLLGNLQGVLEFGAANGLVSDGVVRAVDIHNLEQAGRSDACLLPLPGGCIAYPNEQSSFWWWWRATRISPDGNSITEFPFFSFLLGDLHPHVMAIPFVLLVIGLGLALWTLPGRLSWTAWRERPALLLLAAVLVGGLGFLNTWDLPTFGFLLAALVAARCLTEEGDAAAALRRAAGFLLPLAVLAVLLYAPFYLGFSSQASGLQAVAGEATRPLHGALFWAPLLVVNLPLPVALLWRARSSLDERRVRLVAALPLLLLVLWALLLAVQQGPGAVPEAAGERGLNWLTALFFAFALGAVMLALWQTLAGAGERREAVTPVLLAQGTALLLVLGSELFFIQDLFGSRLNTVFKLYYQAWLLLAFAGAFGLYWLAEQLWPRPRAAVSLGKAALAATTLVVLGCALLYPLGATLSRTNGLAAAGRTLDGLAFMRRDNPDDYAAIQWLAKHAGHGERLVEAVGGQYSPAARVSGATGVPTVLGWPGHERQWGRDPDEIALRHNDVDRAYTTPSLEEALSILRKYRVTYIFVGRVERQTYPASGLGKFEMSLTPVFTSGQTAIYRLPMQRPEGLGQAQ